MASFFISPAAKPHQSKSRHPFGGCNKLLFQYRAVGEALLAFERAYTLVGHLSPSTLRLFREGVAFVSLEVLESYLDDLLDPERSTEYLFIARRDRVWQRSLVALAGLGGALTLGLHFASTGASLFSSFALTVGLAAPFAVVWHYAPRESAVRRMGFAQILSHEISRRRGSSRDRRAGVRFRELLGLTRLEESRPANAC